jgi:hypothetical protein
MKRSIFCIFPILLLCLSGLCYLAVAGGKVQLKQLTSPILFRGDEITAYRDPAVLYHGGTFHLFFTLVETEPDSLIYSYTAHSTSQDLRNWSDIRKITPRDQNLNYCSPGNVIRFADEWILCLQTYPRPGYHVSEIPRYGDETARIFLMRSRDLQSWQPPEIIRVKGPDVLVTDMGRMIDPYLLQDKDDPDKWWCFYKQNGVSMSYSRDLKNWTFFGSTDAGENVCVLVHNDEYLLFHSPANGIGLKYTTDFRHWRDEDALITLGQQNWQWAAGRLTAAAVLYTRQVPELGVYLMFYHGSGPYDESRMFDSHASIGIAWSSDLKNWQWPVRNQTKLDGKQ